MADNEINEIMRALGRIEGILEGMEPTLKSHGEAIVSLQGAENQRKGIAAAISLMVSVALNAISILWKKQ